MKVFKLLRLLKKCFPLSFCVVILSFHHLKKLKRFDYGD